MLKALRKHNKWILVVGGSLLMVGWLLQGSLKQLGPSSKGPVQGTLDGRKVYALELNKYNAEAKAAGYLLPAITSQLLDASSQNLAAHWMILTQEAEAAGFVGGPDDGLDWLQQIAPDETYLEFRSKYRQFDDATFGQIYQQFLQKDVQKQISDLRNPRALEMAAAQGGQMTLDEVQTALAKAHGIFRMRVAYMSAARVSDRSALVSAEKWGDQALVDAAFIPSDLMLSGVPDPTDDELAAHFQQYRDAIPGSGQFGVGYRQPPRVKLEWLKLDKAAIRDALTVDPIEEYKEWQLHRDTYKGEFADEKAKVEAALRDRHADALMQAAAQVVKAEVFKAIKRLDQDGNYKRIPADWDKSRPRLDDIAKAVQTQVSETTGANVPLPSVVIRDSTWQTGDALSADPVLRGAKIHYASHDFSAVQIVFQVRELGGESKFGLQAGIPIIEYPADDAAGDIYFFTVLDARKESPPDSLDEVRAQAVADFKKIKAYQTMSVRADEFRQMAVAGGPGAVIDSFRPPASDPAAPAPKLPTVAQGVTVYRVGSSGGEQLNTEAFRTAVMDAADKIDPKTDPAAYDPSAATVVVPVPEHLGFAVARIKDAKPLTWEIYRQHSEQTLTQVLQTELAKAANVDPFSYQASASRHGWVHHAEDEDQDVQPEPDSSAPAPVDKTPPAKG